MSTPHINQPGGPVQESRHRAVAGRELELRRLADETRRLIELIVTHEATPGATARMADHVAALNEELESLAAGEPAPRVGTMSDPAVRPHDVFPFDNVVGLYNPLARPLELTWDPPVMRGAATFTTPYEGPPGCLHGAVIAGCFDQVFNQANIAEGVAGFTKTLEVTYARPTLLGVPLVFEARVDAVDGRRTTTVGQIVQGGDVTCRAVGVFVSPSRGFGAPPPSA